MRSVVFFVKKYLFIIFFIICLINIFREIEGATYNSSGNFYWDGTTFQTTATPGANVALIANSGAPSFGKINLTTTVTGSLPVANGGMGLATLTTYALLAGGTTSTGNIQQVAQSGSTGNVLNYNGPSALPSWGTLQGLPLTGFGEISVAQPNAQIQIQFPYNINTDYVSTSTTGSGTATSSTDFATLQTGAAINSSATLLSRMRLQYRTGQGCTNLFTAIFTTGVANSTQIIGVGNTQDGFFFGYNGSSFGIMRRANSVDTWVAQASWNQDPMNGAGPSGVTLDPTKGNVYKIQFQWLGFGAINFYIENQNTGAFTLVHQIQYANQNTATSLLNPSLQIMAQVANTTNNTNISLKTPSLAAFIEGITNQIDTRNSINNGKTISTTLTNILNIRNNTTFQSKTNQVVVYPDCLTLYNSTTGTGAAQFTLYLNPTLGGAPSYTNINANTSVVAYDTAGTTITGGKQLFSFYLTNGAYTVLNLHDYNINLVPGDILVIGCASTSGNIDVLTAISWFERF